MDKKTTYIVGIVIGALLFLTNPSESEMNDHLKEKGWVPVKTKHTNLLFCRIADVEGFTGAKGFYVGIGRQMIGTEHPKEDKK